MTPFQTSVIGSDAPRFIAFILDRLFEIEVITLFRPPSSQPIQQDPSIRDSEEGLIEQALAIRSQFNLPFWDALLLYISNRPVKTKNLLKRVTLHNPQDSDAISIHRTDCTESRLREIIEALPSGRMLAISSKMLTKQGEALHLPMLDFHCQASRANDDLVKSVMSELEVNGYIAKSGRSYHFYGAKLMDERSLVTLLGKALLFCPILDRAWIAHQLIERACGLRISPAKDYQNCPEIIFEV